MRPLRWLAIYQALGLLYLAALLWLSLSHAPPKGPALPYADKAGHLLAYGLLMAWWGQVAWQPRWRWGLALGFIAFGGVIEVLQGLGGVRQAEWADAAANAVGVVLGALGTRQRGGEGLAWAEAKISFNLRHK
jgi:VanZ family protein